MLLAAKAAHAQQKVLDRVEQLLRRQLDAPGTAAPAAAPQGAESGYLGMTADDRQDAGKGVRILSVTAGGPAAAAGLEKGDLITSINGQNVRAMNDMVRALNGLGSGSNVTFTVERSGAESRHEVTLGRRPNGRPVEDLPAPPGPSDAVAAGPKIGVRTVDVTPEAQQRNNLPDTAGALVNSVTPGSSAQRAGISLGAVITALDGQKINSPSELAAAVRGVTRGEVDVTFVLEGQESTKSLALTAPAADTPPAPARRARAPIASESRRRPAPTIAPSEAVDPRMAALEARIRELEQRVESLEAAARESK